MVVRCNCCKRYVVYHAAIGESSRMGGCRCQNGVSLFRGPDGREKAYAADKEAVVFWDAPSQDWLPLSVWEAAVAAGE